METSLSYPIGKFESKDNYSSVEVMEAISQIEMLPGALEKALDGLTETQLNTPYREGGWTVRQVVHHLADSHMNAYIRVKWALTEANPVIKAYNEKDWAQTPDSSFSPVASLNLLKALHPKWCSLLKTFGEPELAKSFVHPQSGKSFTIKTLVALYAWHGKHHLAHITHLRARHGW